VTATERPPKERAADLLAAMSFEERIALAVHDFDAVAHLGIAPLRYTDGPNSIRGPENVTRSRLQVDPAALPLHLIDLALAEAPPIRGVSLCATQHWD
jgi:hypothetical protein